MCQGAPSRQTYQPPAEHYILFDQVGDLASSITYLHVALPINLTTYTDQTQLLANTLNSLSTIGAHQYMNSTVAASSLMPNNIKHSSNTSHSEVASFSKVLQDISVQLLSKLRRVYDKFSVLDAVLPRDGQNSKSRQKRFIFMGLYINAEIQRKYFRDELANVTRLYEDAIQKYNNSQGEVSRLLEEIHAIKLNEQHLVKKLINLAQSNETPVDVFRALSGEDLNKAMNGGRSNKAEILKGLEDLLPKRFATNETSSYFSSQSRIFRNPSSQTGSSDSQTMLNDPWKRYSTMLAELNGKKDDITEEDLENLSNIFMVPDSKAPRGKRMYIPPFSNEYNVTPFNGKIKATAMELTEEDLANLEKEKRDKESWDRSILEQLWRYDRRRKGQPITAFFPDEIKRISNMLLESKARLERKFKQAVSESMKGVVKTRQKRFVGVALAGAAVLGTLGTFLGLYSAVEMRSLRRALTELQDQQCLLVQITNEHDIRLKQMAGDLVRITDVIELFIKNNPTVLYAQLEEQIDLLHSRMQQTLQVVQQLQHRRMAVDFLNGDQLQAMHNELLNMAKAQDLTLLPTQISDYFQLECSWLRQGEDILLMLHVPCVHQKHLLKIYKYIPYPFPLPSPVPVLNHAINHALYNGSFTVSDQGNFVTPTFPEGLYVEPEAEFIATGMDRQYKLMSNAELSLCDKHSRVLLCNEHQVLKTKMEDTCMGALFMRSEAAAQERCKFHRKRLEETVHQLSNTNHLVYSPDSFTTTIKCKNGTHFPLFLTTGNNRITVPRGCQAELKDHLITSDFDIQVTPEPLSTIWKWDPLHLSASLLKDTVRVDKQLFALHQEMIRLQEYSSEPNLMEGHFASYLRNYKNYPIGWWIFISCVLGLVLGGAGLHFCRKYEIMGRICPRRRPYADTPPPRRRRPIVRYSNHESAASFPQHRNSRNLSPDAPPIYDDEAEERTSLKTSRF